MLKDFLKKDCLLKYGVLGALLLVYFLFSIITYKDYGITLDEPRVYNRGQQLLNYFTHKTSYKNTIEPTFNLEPKKQRHAPILSEYHNLYAAGLSVFNKHMSYERYHLFNMAFASILIVVSYLAFYKKYKNVFFAAVAPIFIFLTPRFLGHIPANPKDVPFAVIYISTLLIIYLVETSKRAFFKDVVAKSVILGVLFGLTQSFRVIGYSIYIIYAVFILFEIFSAPRNSRKDLAIHYFKVLFLTTVFAHFLMMVTWPYIGSNFFSNLKNVLVGSTTFVEWNKDFLFAGKMIAPETRPASYLFTWLLVTTPPFLLLFFVVSLLLVKKLFKNKLYLLFLISFLLHTLVYLIIKPNIYNGLRHYLFYVVNLVVLATIGFVNLYKIVQKPALKIVLVAALSLCMGLTVLNMQQLHPYQYIYFNKISGGLAAAEGKFPIDYWGASYKEASEWVVDDVRSLKSLKNSPTETFVATCNASAAVEYYGRGVYTLTKDLEKADYVICTQNDLDYALSYTISRKGIVLNNVYKNGWD